MKKVTTFIALVLLLTLCAAPVYAQGIPPLPHAFYGNVTINNNPAPVGATVEARGTGVLTGIAGNPVTTTVAGVYGTSNPFEPRLIVQGDIDEGATITFYVNGRSTSQTAEWHSGVTTQINLDVTIAAVGGGAPGAAPAYTEVEATLFGEEASFLIDDEGEIQETIIATSEDENLDLTIKEGTTALDEDGDPLSWLWADVDPSPPDPPEDASIIGLAYDFGPDGATFDPPIKLEYTYDPDDVPEDVAEKDLVIAYYDEEDEEWVERGLVILAVNLGESPSRLEEFMEGNGLSFPVLLDTDTSAAKDYNARFIPTTFFIDKSGIIKDIKIGAFANKAEIEWRLINSILDGE